MIAYNHVVVIGNLTRDPDVKTVGNGMKLAHLSVCINEKRKTQDGKIVENPVFIDVDAWTRLAEMCEKYLAKNSSVFVEGKLQMSQWEKDGVKHQKLKIRASNIKFLPRNGKFGGVQKDGGKNGAARHSEQDRDSFVPQDEQDTFTPDEPSPIDGDEEIVAKMRIW